MQSASIDIDHPIEARRSVMEHLEALLQSASYLGVFKKLMAMSSTDIAVLFLASKPAFILTAGLAVLTSKRRDKTPQLPSDEDDPPGLLPE